MDAENQFLPDLYLGENVKNPIISGDKRPDSKTSSSASHTNFTFSVSALNSIQAGYPKKKISEAQMISRILHQNDNTSKSNFGSMEKNIYTYILYTVYTVQCTVYTVVI